MTVRRSARRTGELRGVSPLRSGRERPHDRPSGVQTARYVLCVQDVDEVVAPLPIDVQVALTQSLLVETELFDDPTRGDVLRSDVDLHPVQPQTEPRVVAGKRNRTRDHPAS